jgi:hypothetical protein
MAAHELPAAVRAGVADSAASEQPGNGRPGGQTALLAWARNRQARIGLAIIVALAAFCYLGPLL